MMAGRTRSGDQVVRNLPLRTHASLSRWWPLVRSISILTIGTHRVPDRIGHFHRQVVHPSDSLRERDVHRPYESVLV
jgi:hypothetical protein